MTPSYDQAASAVLVIRPKSFGFNQQTAKTNLFQNAADNEKDINRKAVNEFDNFVNLLRKYDVEVIVMEDRDHHITPDSIFPNNWFSTHHDGTVILYPMLAENRRMEVRPEIFNLLSERYYYQFPVITDFTHPEKENIFLEGTGSLVFDHTNKVAYANISSRTHLALVEHVCRLLEYEPVTFYATLKTGDEIYHTNVLLTVATGFAVICAECITNGKGKTSVLEKLSSTGHEIIPITFEQMEKFAGNMLQVKNKNGELLTVMSQTAFDCL